MRVAVDFSPRSNSPEGGPRRRATLEAAEPARPSAVAPRRIPVARRSRGLKSTATFDHRSAMNNGVSISSYIADRKFRSQWLELGIWDFSGAWSLGLELRDRMHRNQISRKYRFWFSSVY